MVAIMLYISMKTSDRGMLQSTMTRSTGEFIMMENDRKKNCHFVDCNI